jgi:hypothetical protein
MALIDWSDPAQVREYKRKQSLASYYANREERIKGMRKWKAANRQSANARNREYMRRDRLENLEKYRTRDRAWKAANPLKVIWRRMIARCTNPKDSGFHKYGARGVTVCERWLNSVDAFIEDMGPSYRPRLTLERKNPRRDYCPENCTWTTKADQARNRRNHHLEAWL